MALLITEDCIKCDVCVTQCPNLAISEGVETYEIDPLLCTECVGYFDEAQCQEGCPVGGIVTHPDWRESRDELEQKYRIIAGQA